MRECRDCLHYRDNYCLVHQSEKYKGCESYWPKDGAKCKTCLFYACAKCGSQIFQIVSDGRREKIYCAQCGTAKGETK